MQVTLSLPLCLTVSRGRPQHPNPFPHSPLHLVSFRLSDASAGDNYSLQCYEWEVIYETTTLAKRTIGQNPYSTVIKTDQIGNQAQMADRKRA